MRRQFLIFAAILLTAMTLALVSCKKDEASVDATTKGLSKSSFQPPQVDDMNAYLRDFKQKMQIRENDETMDLDEAAWHLSSVANYDFGDVVDDYARFHRDTLRYNINVENGRVKVSDLNALYSIASSDITLLFENLNLDNKHIRFIGAKISGNGSVIMSILVSYDWVSHQWAFSDPFTLYDSLSPFYDYDYICDLADFTDTLETVLNLLSAYHPGGSGPSLYYTYSYDVSFVFDCYIDPYHSPSFHDFRVLVQISPEDMTQDHFFYYYDSYLGLAYDSLYSQHNKIIDWDIDIVQRTYSHYYVTCHLPTVVYGTPFKHDPEEPPVD